MDTEILDLKLTNHVALVTGGASGIGKAIATQFAEQGSRVMLLDRDPAAEEIAAEIRLRTGTTTRAILCDVTDDAAMRAAASTTLDTLGRCDHLVCAAGMGSGKYGFPFWMLDPGDWLGVLQVNLLGVVNAAHALVPAMTEARGGTMLFLSSVAGQIGSQTDPPYSAAKAAVINFAQCAAKDLAPFDVRVNVICPGMIKTPLNRSVWKSWNDRQDEPAKRSYEQWAADKIESVAPLKRWQDPEDVAAMAVFLASAQAKNITGQTINVDGGQVMHS